MRKCRVPAAFGLVVALITLLSAATALWAGETPDERAAALLGDAEQLLASGDLQGAESALSSILNDYPDSDSIWQARVRLAECYFRERRLDDCIVEARKVTNLYPSLAPQTSAAWAQYYIGLAYYDKQDLPSAVAETARVAEIVGDTGDRAPLLASKGKMALICHVMNDRKVTVRIASEILADEQASRKDKALALVLKGSALAGDGRVAEGLTLLDTIRAQYPDLQEQVKPAERKIFDFRYMARHDYDGAIAEAKAILGDAGAIEERTRQAGTFLVTACVYKGDYSAAIAEVSTLQTRFSKAGDDQLQWLMLKARAYAKLKDYQAAISTLEEVLAAGPTDKELEATAEWELAMCYRAIGDKYHARKKFMRLIEFFKISHLSDRATKEIRTVK